ncbi:ortholog of Bordetella pertussis (BX470248) BP1829 [plant metagenome]|uniref:Ortholog of Bordetella pertussis (BX470248) BP1829 n=1 Tax=plant metagenome TaxID=1297885 RepID=A0A484UD43_9ZZZZ
MSTASVSRVCRGLLLLGAWQGLSACALVQRLDERLLDGERRQETLRAGHDAFARSVTDTALRRGGQHVARAWLAGRAQPLAREVTLPAALRRDVNTTLLFADGQANLLVLAERISRATGLPVRVQPDALLPQEQFLPRLAAGATGAPVVALPTQASFGDGPRPLPDVLDALSWRLGVHWRYREGVVEFFRVETRVFDVRLLSLDARADARLGRRGQDEPGGFESASSTALTAGEPDGLAALTRRIEPFLSRAGVIAAPAGGAGSVIVTDTRDALDRVARFLETENRNLTRRVRLVFEEVTLIADRQNEGGIDWQVLHRSGRAAASLAGAASGSVTEGASLGAALVGGGAEGSQALVSALARMGTVLRHTRVPVYTLNRRPVTHAVRTTFSYIDQAQTASGGAIVGAPLGSALPSVSVTQKQETTGTFLTLLPDAQADGQILLSVSYDSTVAQPLQTVTLGAEENQVRIQQLTVDGSGTVQQVALRPGQAMIIAGFDRSQDDAQRSRPLEGWPLLAGGRDRLSGQRATTLVMVSAEVEEGF